MKNATKKQSTTTRQVAAYHFEDIPLEAIVPSASGKDSFLSDHPLRVRFLNALAQVQQTRKIDSAIRQQAQEVGDWIYRFILSIRLNTDAAPQAKYIFELAKLDRPITIITDVDSARRSDALKQQLYEAVSEGKEGQEVKDLVDELLQVDQKVKAATKVPENQQEEQSKLVHQVLNYKASKLAIWLMDGGRSVQKGLNQLEQANTIPINNRPAEKSFRVPANFHEQSQKYDWPKRRPAKRLSELFDSLGENSQQKALAAFAEETEDELRKRMEEIPEGINLDPSEKKVTLGLFKLLSDKSQTTDSSRTDYYTGNRPPKRRAYGSGGTELAPSLHFGLYELAKEYKGGESVSGEDIITVAQIILRLSQRMFLISYDETVELPGNKTEVTEIREFLPLISIQGRNSKIIDKLTGETVSKTQTFTISMNPIFRHKIDAKYVEYPADILERTAKAYGSQKISDCTFRFRDYLMGERSRKKPRLHPTINQDTLYWKLCEGWMKLGKKGQVGRYVDEAIKVTIKMGLLASYELGTGAQGQPMYTFHIDKNWAK